MYWFGKDMFISEAYCKITKFKFSIRVKVIDGAVFKEFASVRDSRDFLSGKLHGQRSMVS